MGAGTGRLLLRTGRQGFAGAAGHDLEIEATRWSGRVTVAEDLAGSSVELTIDTGSLRVNAGTGGVKPLSDRDKREILSITRRLLRVDSHPEARFSATEVRPNGTGAELTGTLTLAGVDRPVRLTVSDLGGDRYRATGTVVQSEFGIKPYATMMGALKVADRVTVDAEMDLSG